MRLCPLGVSKAQLADLQNFKGSCSLPVTDCRGAINSGFEGAGF